MKYLLILVVLTVLAVILVGRAGNNTGTPAPVAAAVPATPRDQMRALAKSMGMELQMFVDGGGGNVTFGVRVPEGNEKTARDFLAAAKSEGIVADAMQISSAVTNNNFDGRMTETQFQGSLRQK